MNIYKRLINKIAMKIICAAFAMFFAEKKLKLVYFGCTLKRAKYIKVHPLKMYFGSERQSEVRRFGEVGAKNKILLDGGT